MTEKIKAVDLANDYVLEHEVKEATRLHSAMMNCGCRSCRGQAQREYERLTQVPTIDHEEEFIIYQAHKKLDEKRR